MSDALSSLNALGDAECADAFLRCCGSTKWAQEMVAQRPFAANVEIFKEAESAADTLDRDDWLEAFSHHPMIGDVDRLRERFATTATWSEGEQRGIDGADETVLHNLAEGNRAYQEHFGHIFLVCATGKTAAEMLEMLNVRMQNDPETEFEVATGEQRKITRLRLQKLLEEETV